MVPLSATASRMGSISPAGILVPAFRIIERLQHFQDPAVQLTATAVALCAMSEAIGLDMREVIRIAERTLQDSEGPYTEHIQAIRAYAAGEIGRI